MVSSRVQSSVDLAKASVPTFSNHTVEELEARCSLNRERLALLVVDVKIAQTSLADASKALDTKRKAEAAGESVRSSLRISARSSSWRISTCSSSKRFIKGGVQPQPNIEPLQQAVKD